MAHDAHPVKRWIARKLRTVADRIDDAGAPHSIGYSFTIENSTGIVFHKDGAIWPRSAMKGCPLWTYGADDYQLAFDRAESK